ncbi:hypothetical protein [uncultured Roseobacter sp.]|uniref:hypothetical protein n=1 Tax=uncultured Roseobacter sp. TaxID=114847 RepID=UPI0026285178|nr:hypothetical protein [uncultured Roseobacter sp.]
MSDKTTLKALEAKNAQLKRDGPVESFNGKMRGECMSRYLVPFLRDACGTITA